MRHILLLFLLSGCSVVPTPERKFPDGWTLVDCSECKGVGKVTYTKDDWIVKNGHGGLGTFQCPICNGDKKLYEMRIR